MGDVRIEFPADFDERARVEHEMKGWLAGVTVRVASDEPPASVTFVDPVRLSQELADNAASGKPWVIESNLIVVERVSEDNMRRAIMAAVSEGVVLARDRG
jgi:hypothetical protein